MNPETGKQSGPEDPEDANQTVPSSNIYSIQSHQLYLMEETSVMVQKALHGALSRNTNDMSMSKMRRHTRKFLQTFQNHTKLIGIKCRISMLIELNGIELNGIELIYGNLSNLF